MARLFTSLGACMLLLLAASSAPAASFNDCVDAYFDMTDFIRAQAWERE